jgi:hypothetical protein
MTERFRVYAWLNGIRGALAHKYYYINTEDVSQHATKLNLLSDIIYFNSVDKSNDLIVFLDGDAFPIGDIITFARQKLKTHLLVAVQRLENNGDLQPHPSFCVTTVDSWKQIGGDWKQGHTWLDPNGRAITDVGGNLLGILQRRRVDWYPMHRSNRFNLHPLWFGIYEGLIYHHGAGFRDPLSRVDSERIAAKARGTWRWPLAASIRRLDPGRRWDWLQRLNPVRSLEKRAINENQNLNARVFKSLRDNPEFYREFG